MPRGGKRTGAGRPKGSGRYGEPTENRRIPLSLVEKIDAMLKRAEKREKCTIDK